MEPYQFILNPGQYAELNINFHAIVLGGEDESGEEKRVDVIQTGTYINTIEDRFAKSFAHANVDEPNPPITTQRNATATPISYDIRACFKTARSGRVPWTDINEVSKNVVTPNLYRITFMTYAVIPPSQFRHKERIDVSVEVRQVLQ